MKWAVRERRACRLFGISRSVYRYEHRRDQQDALRRRLRELAAIRVRFGYLRLWALLRREGWQINRKRVYRLYKLEGLEVRTKKRHKIAGQARVPAPEAGSPNERWAIDFVSDRMADGSAFRVLTVVDHFSRLNLALEARRSFRGEGVVQVLERLAEEHGYPDFITLDNGPEFAGKALDQWAFAHGVRLDFIRPGKPVENCYIESFNGRFRDECLNVNVFFSITDATHKLAHWQSDYNNNRPHSALDGHTPNEFLRRFEAAFAQALSFDLDDEDPAARGSCQGKPSVGARGAGLDRTRRPAQRCLNEIEGAT